MKAPRTILALLLLTLLFPTLAGAQQDESYDYWNVNRQMIQNGVQAVLMCNGLFTSNRSLERVFDQELAYLRQPVGTARGGDYEVDRERKAVAVGVPGGVPVMRAAFREGIGCVVLAPDQTFEDIPSLPKLDLPPPPGRPGHHSLARRGPGARATTWSSSAGAWTGAARASTAGTWSGRW